MDDGESIVILTNTSTELFSNVDIIVCLDTIQIPATLYATTSSIFFKFNHSLQVVEYPWSTIMMHSITDDNMMYIIVDSAWCTNLNNIAQEYSTSSPPLSQLPPSNNTIAEDTENSMGDDILFKVVSAPQHHIHVDCDDDTIISLLYSLFQAGVSLSPDNHDNIDPTNGMGSTEPFFGQDMYFGSSTSSSDSDEIA